MERKRSRAFVRCTCTRKLAFWFIRFIFRRLAFAYLHLEVRGLEHIPSQGGAIIAGNHPSVLDGVLLLAVSPRPVRFLIAEDLYYHRYLHWFFTVLECIPVYRTKTHNGDALRAAVSALQQGALLGIFPEGTIHFQGSMQQVKRGVALLALKTGLPVVPLAIQGSCEAFPDGARVPRPRIVQMYFDTPKAYPKTTHDPIPNDQVVQVLEGIRQDILKTIDAIAHELLPWFIPRWVKEIQIVVAGLVIWPLAGFLTLTSNPSLDPVKKGQLA